MENKETKINEDDINGDFIRLPGDLAYWNQKAALAHKAMLKAKTNVEFIESKLYLKIRQEAETKLTEAHLNAMVITDPSYQEAKNILDEAESTKAELAGVVDAIRSKRDCLISLGANMRAEFGTTHLNNR